MCCFSGTKSEMTEFNQGIFTPRLQSSSLTLSTRPSPSIFLFIIGASPSVREVSYAQMRSSNANMVAFVRRTRSRSPSTRAFPKRGRSPASAPCPLLQHNAPSQSGLPHRTCAPLFFAVSWSVLRLLISPSRRHRWGSLLLARAIRSRKGQWRSQEWSWRPSERT